MFDRFRPLIDLVRKITIPWALLTSACVLTLLETAAALSLPLLTRELIEGAEGGAVPTPVLTALVVVLLVQATLSGVSLYLLTKAGEQMTLFLRNKLFGRLVRLPMKFHDDTESGSLVSRTISDTTSVQNLLTEQTVSFVAGVVSMSGAIIILWWLDWRLTLVLFSSVLFGLLLILPLAVMLQAIGRDVQNSLASFSGRMTQILGEIRLAKASCAEEQECGTAAKSVDHLRNLLTPAQLMFDSSDLNASGSGLPLVALRALAMQASIGLKEARILAVLGPAVTLAITGALIVILSYGGTRVSIGALSVGTLVAFILYLFQIVVPMIQFSTFFAALSKAAGAAEHLSHLLDEPMEDRVEHGILSESACSLRFEKVGFAYEDNKPVMCDFDLEIPQGKVTALVGPSGSGKTTVLGLLERFYLPGSGRILYGDTPLEIMALEPWRRRIGYVPQEVPLLSGSVRDNLCYGLDRQPTDAELADVMRAARVDQFVSQLSGGLETEVGERGVKLSGGQRQRLAIARAFLVDPVILMLDEATASLDAESEVAIRAALAELMSGRTTLVVAHRLSTVVGADQIAVVEGGMVTGLGTHDYLLKSHDLYRRLVEQQLVGLDGADRP
jgi:ATP-binding cassette subfamily B protein AbcA/BmrA